MGDNTHLLLLSKEELKEIVKESISEVMRNHKEESKSIDKEDDYVEREAVCKKFNISKPTLWRWTNKGLLRKRKFAGRVYYSKLEIAALMESQVT